LLPRELANIRYDLLATESAACRERARTGRERDRQRSRFLKPVRRRAPVAQHGFPAAGVFLKRCTLHARQVLSLSELLKRKRAAFVVLIMAALVRRQALSQKMRLRHRQS
jgi:hypothetical protein